jgi:hypothetical protein
LADQVRVPNTPIPALGRGVSSIPSTLTPRTIRGLLNTSDTSPNPVPVQQGLPNSTPYSVAAVAVRGRGKGQKSK